MAGHNPNSLSHPVHEGHTPTAHTLLPIGYFWVYLILLILLGATVSVAYWNLGVLNIIVAMTIAIIKMLLVILFFMHVKFASRLTWLWASAGFFWLVILFSLTLSDYITRGWLALIGR